MSRTVNSNPIQSSDSREGTFTRSFHLEMISDHERVGQCLRAVRMFADTEKHFVEIGCGTGLFSIEAAKYYAAVTAIEKDPHILEVAKWAAKKAGVLQKIRFIEADAFNVSREDITPQADVVFTEMLSIWLIEEPQVLMCNHITANILGRNGTMTPRRVTNLLECGNYNFNPFGISLKAPIAEFVSGLAPRLNTVSQLAQVVDFRHQNQSGANGVLEFYPLTQELINCVRLSSIVEFGPGLNFYSTETLMPVTIFPTNNEYQANLGDIYRVSYDLEYGRPLGEATFRIDS